MRASWIVTALAVSPWTCETTLDEVEAELAAESAVLEQAAEALLDDTGSADGAAVEVVQEPATTLPFTLLAALTGKDDPTRSRATIRDDETGVIASYAIGDAIRERVHVLAIEPEAIVLDEEGVRSRLAFATEPVEMGPNDVVYPDLVADDDHVSNAMADAVQLPAGMGYLVKTPERAWGTPRSVHALRTALLGYRNDGLGGPEIHVGDLSRAGGGPLPPHVSHQSGRDVDIGYVLRGASASERRFVTATRTTLDVERTWALLEHLLATGDVTYVFMDYDVQGLLYEGLLQGGVASERLQQVFQYPHGPRAVHGVVRHWRGHADHFHVRFAR